VITNTALSKYRNPLIAQLAERETVDGYTTVISRSLVRIRVSGQFFLPCFLFMSVVWPMVEPRQPQNTKTKKKNKTKKKEKKEKNDSVPINETT
jgi:hypothetical protein